MVKLSSKPNSTPQEAVGKSKTVAKSVTHENADNEGESVRPKRGRPTKRYTEYVLVFFKCVSNFLSKCINLFLWRRVAN